MKRKNLFSIMCILSLFTFFTYIVNNSTDVYADPSDAPITTTTVQTTSRKAPVSINNYSNVVTESADTYDYSVSVPNTIEAVPYSETTTTPVVESTPTPAPPQNNAPSVEVAPAGTGSPDATPEPDMISYPPTVAPAYTD